MNASEPKKPSNPPWWKRSRPADSAGPGRTPQLLTGFRKGLESIGLALAVVGMCFPQLTWEPFQGENRFLARLQASQGQEYLRFTCVFFRCLWTLDTPTLGQSVDRPP